MRYEYEVEIPEFEIDEKERKGKKTIYKVYPNAFLEENVRQIIQKMKKYSPDWLEIRNELTQSGVDVQIDKYYPSTATEPDYRTEPMLEGCIKIIIDREKFIDKWNTYKKPEDDIAIRMFFDMFENGIGEKIRELKKIKKVLDKNKMGKKIGEKYGIEITDYM